VKGDMRVRIHDSRRHVLASGINRGDSRRSVDVLPDRSDLAILDVNRAVLDVAVRYCHDNGILDDDVLMSGWCRCLTKRGASRQNQGSAESNSMSHFHAMNPEAKSRS